MACLTREQLARLALGLDECEPMSAHVERCETCQAKLAEMRALVAQLSAVHAELDGRHAATRSRLLASLSREKPPAKPLGVWNRLTSQWERLTAGQRLAVGGVGLSTAALVVLMLALVSSATRLSAMERLVKAVREVKSYSFQFTETIAMPPPRGKRPFLYQLTIPTYWQAPDSAQGDAFGSLYAETKSFAIQAEGDEPTPRLHLVEIFPSGKPGMLIDHVTRIYFWAPGLRAGDISENGSIAMLRAVRDGEGRIVRDLGTRQIDGRQARGYVVAFGGAPPFRRVDEVEVWVDPETDLPLEFSFHSEFEDDGRQVPEEFRVTDCRWNIEIDRDLFDTTPPEGYTDTTPPDRQEDTQEGIAKIIAALRLYAQLSGHYPQVTKFDGEAIHDEMLKMAGFTGPPQDESTDGEKHRQIQQASAGLDRLSRILLDVHNSRYFGQEVGPQDNDKVLLWWTVDSDELYRVFYGDLRTEVVTPRRLAVLLPVEAERLGIGLDD